MEDHTPKTKIEGRTEFLNKLDNIQKELDAMPEKKDSDKGVTNAMKNYYGVSYEKFDDALNEIYTLLKKELSPEVMKELQAEQLRWIEQKETKAEKERLKYEGGTFENVAWYISLYESTKDRCYELVNEYMTD
ncbi:lysozyme inhibitor LprI family protein [Rossellomorea sp. y25]|uniref:lysozyme inhibitor LprI family protein n=1 Tax=Rossellomorea sp. y25 TaxID=3118174 RepID=UPI0030E47367